MNKYILASNSPRRKQLMEMLGIDYEIIISSVDEIIRPDLANDELVMDLAFQKAADIFRHHQDDIVLGFDTMVYIDDKRLGKPKNAQDAKEMLTILSGKTHVVITGCAIITKKISKSFFEATKVTFYPMTNQEIDQYITSKEPFDKAGAYAVQGLGSKFVQTIDGDFYTVMGLPVARLYHELKELNLL
ncbi:MAG: Maf family protein [Candidatus Izemoplasmatales bacterium]|nr:Maf family protein [Candidatus Izemoplasmatales bacterium]MDD3865736.1 Maf family protein [Candidatus Izemoplasmatales bacterium]